MTRLGKRGNWLARRVGIVLIAFSTILIGFSLLVGIILN
jgi:hypothetical protein